MIAGDLVMLGNEPFGSVLVYDAHSEDTHQGFNIPSNSRGILLERCGGHGSKRVEVLLLDGRRCFVPASFVFGIRRIFEPVEVDASLLAEHENIEGEP